MFKQIYLLIFLTVSSTWAHQLDWFLSPHSPTAIALTVHGLNLAPSKMSTIIHQLNDWGISCLNLSLTGHEEDKQDRMKDFKEVTAKKWIAEFKIAYQKARTKAQEHQVPLYLVGFSLGGLVGTAAFNNDPEIQFSKMILFAPAIRIKSLSKILSLLQFMPHLAIPSASPAAYRCNPATPIAAYTALYNLEDSLNFLDVEKINIPTVIFCSERDELVSYRKIGQMISDHNLSNWHLIPIHKSATDPELDYQHLIIDQICLGNDEWEKISRLMESFHLSY